MLYIELGEKEYKMPNGWDELNLDKYLKIMTIFNSDKSELKKILDIISLLGDIDKNVLYDLEMSELNKIDLTWISQPMRKDIKTEIEIDGVTYKMVKDIKKISLGEYADLDEYMKNSIKNLHYISAILIREIENGELVKYNSDKLEDRALLFREKMSIEQLLGVFNFFSHSVNGS